MGKRQAIKIFWALIVLLLLGTNQAFAHRFNIALILPLSGTQIELGTQYRDGFFLATTQRDAHLNETSDGHLGGLDSYISIIDAGGDIDSQIRTIISENKIDIVVADFTPAPILSEISSLLQQANIALLSPSLLTVEQLNLNSIVEFNQIFENQYDIRPSTYSIQGYNAAYRIDEAVRAQAGVGNYNLLLDNFTQSANEILW